MSKEDVSTPAEEVSSAPEAKEESAAEATAEAKEETIASAMSDKSESNIPDSIPYNRFKEKVDENKELQSRIEKLEQLAQEQDMSKKEVASEVKDLAEEYGIDSEVLDKLSEKLYSKAQATIEEKLAPLTQKEQREQQDKILNQMLDKALEANPDFLNVVNKDVLKQLALNPANADKTFTQLMQETYGNVVQSPDRKTMETTSPGKSEVIDKVDYNRAQTDSEYFAKIKADPKLKAEYNEMMRQQISRYM